MEIKTLSHIDDKHAASQYFPFAESIDGLFYTSGDGYVAISCALSGLPPNTGDGLRHAVYLQYGNLDTAVPPEMLAQAREFAQAVRELRESRRIEVERREIAAIKAEREARGPIPKFPYRSSDEAWEAEDEFTWAQMIQWGL